MAPARITSLRARISLGSRRSIKVADNDTDKKDNLEPGTVKGGTEKYPSTDKDTPHVQRDGWVWDDETGWNPPKD